MSGLFYRTVKHICTLSLKFYFRKWQVSGLENLPKGPVIFVPNHQNAFLDAIIVTCSSEKNPWFMTRAKVFEKPRAAKLLRLLQMLPIYRFRDGYATLKKNEQVMDDMLNKLNDNNTILIFAEGNHNDKHQLRPLQKGVARLALTEKAENAAIVPVGIQYDSLNDFRSRVLVSFGKPLYVKKMNLNGESTQEKIEVVMDSVRNGLQPLMLHISSPEYDEKLFHLKKFREHQEDLVKQLASDQLLVNNYPRPGQIKNRQSSLLQKFCNAFMRINLFIPIFVLRKFILEKLKESQFTGSVKFAAGMLLVPVFVITQSVLIGIFTGSFLLGILYFISIPLSMKLS